MHVDKELHHILSNTKTIVSQHMLMDKWTKWTNGQNGQNGRRHNLKFQKLWTADG
jgi:hypothetical protein